MKTIKYLLICMSLLGLTITSCGEESVTDPSFGEKEIPYIYTNRPLEIFYTIGEPAYFDIKVSPNDGTVKCKWLLDGNQISTSVTLDYTFTEEQVGVHDLKFEAERNGIKNSREYILTIHPIAEE